MVLKLTLEAFPIWFSPPFWEVSICKYSVLPRPKASKYSLIHLLFNTTLESCPKLGSISIESIHISLFYQTRNNSKKMSEEYKHSPLLPGFRLIPYHTMFSFIPFYLISLNNCLGCSLVPQNENKAPYFVMSWKMVWYNDLLSMYLSLWLYLYVWL